MSRFLVTATWDDIPHLTQAARDELWNSIPPYQRDARVRGIPQLGAGVIYAIPEEDVVLNERAEMGFRIPQHWLRGYALDVGWQKTAAIFRAIDPDTRISYAYAEYYRGEADPEVHAAGIRRLASQRSDGTLGDVWIPGRIDPAARGRSQKDGEQLLRLYRELIYGTADKSLGARMLQPANNGVESGIYTVLMGFQTGGLKILKRGCPNLLEERRWYRRDEKGRVVKSRDHALDCLRYNVASGDKWLVAEPAPAIVDPVDRFRSGGRADGLSWMSS